MKNVFVHTKYIFTFRQIWMRDVSNMMSGMMGKKSGNEIEEMSEYIKVVEI